MSVPKLELPEMTKGKRLVPELHKVSAKNSSPPPRAGISSCGHSSDLTSDSSCGLCWLILIWESEVPKKIHAYKVLADNGNPQVSASFLSHMEASFGLVRPKPDVNLHSFRLARVHLYKAPAKKQYPLMRALWDTMGFQPSLTTALIRSLQGRTLIEIATELKMTPYGTNLAISKAIRMITRKLGAYNAV